jgi:RNA recognition motif-containing protein
MAKVFCSGLPRDANEQDVRELFEQYGVHAVHIVHDRTSGISRGFAFIGVADVNAERAIRELDGLPFQGRLLRVQLAEKQ